MTRCIALLRGINVGRARRLAMADLRRIVLDLGASEVATVLNSGNVVMTAPRSRVATLASAMSAALAGHSGFEVPVVVVTADELDAVIAANTLVEATQVPDRLLVAFASASRALAPARVLLERDWTPEALTLARRAAYLWCAEGVLASRLLPAFTRATGGVATARNWSTVLKLQRLARG